MYKPRPTFSINRTLRAVFRLFFMSLILNTVSGIAAANEAGSTEHSQIEYNIFGIADIGWATASTKHGWLEEGFGKTRFDEETDGAYLGFLGLGLDLDFNLETSFKLRLVGDQELKPTGRITEVFMEYSPAPTSAWKQQWQAGFFYAPFSLENRGPLWTSPYTVNISAINTWIAEELRTLGVQHRLTYLGLAPTSNSKVSLIGSFFFSNDPAGSLLSWRGWALHDLQAGLGSEIPFPALSNFNPGEEFENQAPYSKPFEEIDNRPGFYVGADWSNDYWDTLAFYHYDNQADPSILESGQYAWRTRFDLLNFEKKLPFGITVLLQWMKGDTRMENKLNEPMVINDFQSHFLLLSKRMGATRLSLRYEEFQVDDLDQTPHDSNDEWGHAWTLSASHVFQKRIKVSAEYLSIDSWRKSRHYWNIKPKQTESQWLVSARYFFK